MSRQITAARYGNPANDCVILQTSDAGEALLDLRDTPRPETMQRMGAKNAAEAVAKGWRHHDPVSLAAFKEWRAAGNVPADYEAPPLPEPSAEEIEREALRAKLTEGEKAAARARLLSKR